MTLTPTAALTFSDIRPGELIQAEQKYLGNQTEAHIAALMSYRLMMVNHMKGEVAQAGEITGAKLLAISDLAAQLYLPRYAKIVGPYTAEAYIEAYRAAKAGDVPMSMIYALAERHVDRIGLYFHETSREALVEGFNTFVNRRMASRAAADRVLDAYGLTPRQMRSYTAVVATEAKIDSSLPQQLKAKALDYIGRSLRSRLKIFASQEEYNISTQAEQMAWMWLQDHGQISEYAEKKWLTARDEKVCKICGPMNGKKVLVGEQFTLPNGYQLYVPGAHPNCRCRVRMLDPVVPITRVQKAAVQKDLYGVDLAEFKREHPQDNRSGRFIRKPKVMERERPDLTQFQAFLDEAARTPATPRTPTTPAKPKLNVRNQLSVSERPKLKFGGQQPQLFAPPPKPRLSIAPEQKLSITGEPKPRVDTPIRITPKLAFSEPVGDAIPEWEIEQHTEPLLKPIYAVVEDDDTERQFADEFFHVDEMTALHDAEALRDEKREYVISERMPAGFNEPVRFKYNDPIHGPVEVAISDDDLRYVVNSVIYADEGNDVSDSFLLVEMFSRDESGRYFATKKLGVLDIAEAMEIHPEDLRVRIIRLDRVHKSDRMGNAQHHSGTKFGLEGWDVSGSYELVETSRAGMDSGLVDTYFTMQHLEPYDPEQRLRMTGMKRYPGTR